MKSAERIGILKLYAGFIVKWLVASLKLAWTKCCALIIFHIFSLCKHWNIVCVWVWEREREDEVINLSDVAPLWQPKYQNYKFSNTKLSVVINRFRWALCMNDSTSEWVCVCAFALIANQKYENAFSCFRKFPGTRSPSNVFAFVVSQHPDDKIFTRNGFAVLAN